MIVCIYIQINDLLALHITFLMMVEWQLSFLHREKNIHKQWLHHTVKMYIKLEHINMS